MKCLIEIHGERSTPLPPVLPWLPINGRALKNPLYETPHAEHGTWGTAIAESLIAAVNAYRATQPRTRETRPFKKHSSLAEPLDALAARCKHDKPHDNPDGKHQARRCEQSALCSSYCEAHQVYMNVNTPEYMYT